MSYRESLSSQISMDDSFGKLSDRTKRIVEKSWAKDFAKYVFPAISSSDFKVLYSDNKASRPSTPANYVVGALIIKEMFGMTDDETVEFICCDVRAQYALHSMDLPEQPISDRTFSRFRERLYNHEQETGVDLLQEEMIKLSDKFCEYLKIDKKVKRMDSLMIAMHAKNMARLEIIYTTVQKCVKMLHKNQRNDLIPEDMKHYLDPDDLNEVIYHAKDEEVEQRLQKAVDEALRMKEILNSDEWIETTEYQLLIRLINEQTENGKPKEKSKIRSNSMQNPNDPDATYRKKAGKDHKGYVGNIEESIGDNGASIITDFSYDQNTHPDQSYSREYIDKHENETMIADGAYGSTEIQKAAEEKNINLVTTCLTGKDPDPVYADYKLNEDGTEVIECPNGNKPESCQYNEKTESIRMKMMQGYCAGCPLREKCHVQDMKTEPYAVITVSRKMVLRAVYLKKLGTKEYKKLSRQRNAVEGIMSVLRRKYQVDHIPVFGLKRSKIFFYFKVGAFNVVKLLTHIHDKEEKTNTGLVIA